jgi:putative oxidoreductase
MLAGMFVFGGIDAVRHPATKASMAGRVAPPIAQRLGLPTDPTSLVRLNGAAQILGGSLLALGKLPRLSSTVLAASLVPTTLAGHPFWEEVDKGSRAQQEVQFLKNTAMLGGLILAAADSDGRPSMTWRMRRQMHRGRRARRQLGRVAHDATTAAATTVQRAAATGRALTDQFGDATHIVAQLPRSAADVGADTARTAAGHGRHVMATIARAVPALAG